MTSTLPNHTSMAGDPLASVPLFAGLQPAERSALGTLLRERTYTKGNIIVFAHDPGDALFVVASGQVKVVLIAEDGREVILSVLGPGRVFGELALVDDQPRSAHVIALEDARLLVLHRRDFQTRLRESPELALALLRELSQRIRRADDTIRNLITLDVNGRVADLLLRLSDEEDGEHITRRLTHQTIAQMVGTSRETVSRTMRHLVDTGVLTVTRKEIVIRDRGALNSAARRG
jgi:CRP/FNR family transcriptional regulator, cyclic AMP receptor protein